MLVKTTQVDGDDALRAVADGKSVQMIWTNDGKPFFSNFTEKIQNAMAIGEAFLIVEISDSCENIADSCEIAAEEIHPEPEENVPETVVTDPDTTPITVEIPNSKKAEKERWRKLDDDLIAKLHDDGLTERQIAAQLDTTQVTIHNHITKMKKEARL